LRDNTGIVYLLHNAFVRKFIKRFHLFNNLQRAFNVVRVINEIINEFCEKSPKAIGFGVVNPADGENSYSPEEIVQKWDVKGFALYPVSHGFHPADTRAMDVYRFAEANSMPVFFYIPEKLEAPICLNLAARIS